MWCGIAAIVLMGIPAIGNHIRYDAFFLCVFLVALVTGGLICTFKSQEQKDTPQDTQQDRDTQQIQDVREMQDIRDEILKKRRFKIRKDDTALVDSKDDQKPKT
jgi:hypothetical protein